MKSIILIIALLIAGTAQAFSPVCAPSSYNPYTTAWPTHGYCVWAPGTNTYGPTNQPPFVRSCSDNPNPGWGEAYLYSGKNYTGQCAKIWTYGGYQGSVWNFADMSAMGWDASAAGVPTIIQSVKVGGSASWGGLSTRIQLWAAPTINGVCNFSTPCIDISNSASTPWNIPNWNAVSSIPDSTEFASMALSAF